MGVILCFICLLVVGALCIYSGYSMKETGKLRVGWLVGRDLKYEKCRDIPGFIEAIYQKTVTFGWIAVISSVIIIVLQVFEIFIWLMFPVIIVVFGAYIWFNNALNKATKEFLD